MKNLYVNEIELENIQTLLNFINDNDKIRIYIDSHGGSCHLFQIFLDCINKNKERIEVFACGFLNSMAFSLFFRFEGKKEVLPYSSAYLHYSGGEVRLLNNGNVEKLTDRMYIQKEKEDNLYEKFFFQKIGLTKKELQDLEKGNPVILSTSRLMELNKQTL